MENVKLGRRILDLIDKHPEKLRMRVFGAVVPHCGTVACLAGHAMLLSGYKMSRAGGFYRPDGTRVPREEQEAMRLLGMEDGEQFFGTLHPGDECDEIWFDYTGGPDRFRKLVEESEGQQ